MRIQDLKLSQHGDIYKINEILFLFNVILVENNELSWTQKKRSKSRNYFFPRERMLEVYVLDYKLGDEEKRKQKLPCSCSFNSIRHVVTWFWKKIMSLNELANETLYLVVRGIH